MLSKIFNLIIRHKLIAVIGLLIIIIGGYFGYKKIAGNENLIQYATAAVEKGTLIVSISGSGQVSVSNQIDIKPKVSGDVVYVGVKNGQEVKAGVLLAQIDSRDAQKAVRDAETALETAKLELEKLLQPVDDYSLMQAENALIQTKDNLTKLKFTQESNYQDALDIIQRSEDNLEKAYEDAFNTIADVFLDLPTIITGLRDVLYSYEIAESEITLSNFSWNISALKNSVDYSDRSQLEKFIDNAENNYKTARTKYAQNFENYKNASRYSDKEVIEALLDETLETVRAMAETVKSETNMLDYWVDYRSGKDLRIFSKVTEYQSDLKSYTSKTNSHVSGLLSIQRNIQDNKEAKLNAERDLIEMKQNQPLDLAAAERSVKEKEEALAKLKADPDELDVRAKNIAMQQKQDALLTAQQSLADHYVYAPFNGVVANINVKKGESISSSAVLAVLITKQKIAEITLNEIDIAKIEPGQKVTIIFDAIEDLTITGEVVEIDTLGTVSQGVVTYNIKIRFDTQDERVKPGMSLSATIITNVKQNALLVPNSAIKQQGDTIYVQVADGAAAKASTATANISDAMLSTLNLRTQPIQTGLSNDIMTEVLDGLQQGDRVITQTISSNTAKNQNLQAKPSTGGMMRTIRF